ncbi:hypothetical protein [Microcoleus sp. Pol12A5]|uniref:hypothetical protein n=1 Tax=Microcoleus sp. Pol12A5 TaxID=3055392 RepID=UPI002FD2E28F
METGKSLALSLLEGMLKAGIVAVAGSQRQAGLSQTEVGWVPPMQVRRQAVATNPPTQRS